MQSIEHLSSGCVIGVSKLSCEHKKCWKLTINRMSNGIVWWTRLLVDGHTNINIYSMRFASDILCMIRILVREHEHQNSFNGFFEWKAVYE
jgi:hypothetical protein